MRRTSLLLWGLALGAAGCGGEGERGAREVPVSTSKAPAKADGPAAVTTPPRAIATH